jgi:hypothetical protein
VAGAVGEEVAKAGGANHGARRVVGLEAADRPALREGLLDSSNGGVARVAHGIKDELLFRGLAADRRRSR